MSDNKHPLARQEYAVELLAPFRGAVARQDAYPRLGDARRAAKQWLKERPPGYEALILKRTTPFGVIGAQWVTVGRLTWSS